MSSSCYDCTFNQYVLYWLVYHSWHWILIWINASWWDESTINHRSRLQPPSNALSWLEKDICVQRKMHAAFSLFILFSWFWSS
ncbi:hypothetical protein BDV40DRAFT_271196 [Aspergillus tamarii]|uniref:Uncharacterized protein n=1 Tax=Aspergillus tamarii TaxID=41984 RepID=A0A5N6UP07_ASPTM|nr:hypothetical protein BDV40DRAFT_271196 [Aspergillus tamarii]